MNENALNSLDGVSNPDQVQEEGFKSRLKALEDALEEANATYDAVKAKEIQDEISLLHLNASAKYDVVAPEIESSPVTATEENMGPPKDLFNQKILETSESRKNAEAYISQDLESIAKALHGGENIDADGFARKVNSIASDLEKLWQGRVRRELSGSSEFGEDYKRALVTPEAQAIYDEELTKFDAVLGDPSLKILSDAFRGVKVANYKRLNEDEIGAKLAKEQARKNNAGRYSNI